MFTNMKATMAIEDVTPKTIERQYLYRWYDIEDRLLYVGITNDPFGRSHAHISRHKFFKENIIAKTLFKVYDSREEVMEAERLAIIEEKPIYNVIYNRESNITSKSISISGRKSRKHTLENYLNRDYLHIAEYCNNAYHIDGYFDKNPLNLDDKYDVSVFEWAVGSDKVKNEGKLQNLTCYLIMKQNSFKAYINNSNIEIIMIRGYSLIHASHNMHYNAEVLISFVKEYAEYITYEMLYNLMISFNTNRFLCGLGYDLFNIIAEKESMVSLEYVKWMAAYLDKQIKNPPYSGEMVVKSDLLHEVYVTKKRSPLTISRELWDSINCDPFKKKMIECIQFLHGANAKIKNADVRLVHGLFCIDVEETIKCMPKMVDAS